MEDGENDNQEGFITASPLDYHLFRQEITSKYPAYCPPQPLLPIELENNSILPPLPNHASRRTSQESLPTRAVANVNGNVGSILNQPVHIATPAPSPPPSPAGPGGKGGKKQNYQTNQNFPFLYPPLDDTSNTVGGKGSAELQDKLVGKRWEGSDVPASIQEAGQLFASRMRMSRPIRQLWDVREEFVKHERGWNGAADDDDGASCSDSESETKGLRSETSNKTRNNTAGEINDASVQERLDAVDSYYVSEVFLANASCLTIVVARCTTTLAINGCSALEVSIRQCLHDGVSERIKWASKRAFFWRRESERLQQTKAELKFSCQHKWRGARTACREWRWYRSRGGRA